MENIYSTPYMSIVVMEAEYLVCTSGNADTDVPFITPGMDDTDVPFITPVMDDTL